MKYPTNLPKRTFSEIHSELAARIQPLLDQGEVTIAEDPKYNYPDGDVTLKLGVKYMFMMLSPEEHPLNSKALNYGEKKRGYYNTEVKRCGFYIDETVSVPVKNLRLIRIYNRYKESLFSRKTYGRLMTAFPINAVVNGESRPVAKNTVFLILPETECKKLMKYLDLYSETDTMKIRVKGPARLSGGHAVSIGGREWLEYDVDVFVEDYLIEGII